MEYMGFESEGEVKAESGRKVMARDNMLKEVCLKTIMKHYNNVTPSLPEIGTIGQKTLRQCCTYYCYPSSNFTSKAFDGLTRWL